jgi:hypothetical protein
VGGQTSIQFSVANVSGTDATYQARLWLNETQIAFQEVNVAAGGSTLALFNVSPAEGTYEVRVDRSFGSLVVGQPAPTPTPSPTVGPIATPTVAPTPTTVPPTPTVVGEQPTPTPTVAPPPVDSGGGFPLIIIIIVVVVVIVGGGIAFIVFKRGS